MSDEKRKPTPEEKAQAAAEARAKAEALRKLREQEASGEHTADEVPATEEPVHAEAARAPVKPVSEMTQEEKAAAKAAAAAEAIAKAKAAKEAKESQVAVPAKPASEMTPEEKAAAKAAAAAEAIAKAKAAKEAKESQAAAPAKPASEMTQEEKAAAKAAAAAEAIAKAKAAKEAKESAAPSKPVSEMTPEEKAAAKAAAAAEALAKAKAAKEAKEAAAQGAEAGDTGTDADAKAKAAAAAKAKAAAAAKAKGTQAMDDAGGSEETPKAPSKNQPYLDKYISRLTEAFGPEALEASYINELAKEVPTLVIKNESWLEVARFLKEDEQLGFDYLSDLHGVDYEDRMEVYYHLYSYKNRQSVAVKVKTGREQSAVPSVMDIWYGANWNERETFDLLGIHFPGHRDMRRILLPDDWVGYPLRKDYVQYDEEV